MIDGAGPKSIELVRNPEFEEWSAAAQPDGFVNAISWRFRRGSSREPSTGSSAGELDGTPPAPAPEDPASLRSAHPDQVIASPGPFTLFVGFDVLEPPSTTNAPGRR